MLNDIIKTIWSKQAQQAIEQTIKQIQANIIKERRFLIALDEYFDRFSYYDEELDQTIIDGNEEDCYNVLMQTDEFHLIGEKRVRELIHIGFTDWEKFNDMLNKYNAHA